MKWNHIVFSSITLALRYKKSSTGTFRKGPPKLIHVLILSERARQIHGDGAKRRDISGDKRLVFAVVAAEMENLRVPNQNADFTFAII